MKSKVLIITVVVTVFVAEATAQILDDIVNNSFYGGLFTEVVDPNPDLLQIQFLGTNCIFISDGTTRLMIDPNFTRPNVGYWGLVHGTDYIESDSNLCKWALITSGITTQEKIDAEEKTLDAIFVSHTHFDHVLDVASVWELTGKPLIFGSQSALRVLEWHENDEPTRFNGLTESFRLAEINSPYPEEMNTIDLGDSNFEIAFVSSYHLSFLDPKSLLIPIPIIKYFVPFDGVIDDWYKLPTWLREYKSDPVMALLISHPRFGRILNTGSAGYGDNCLGSIRAETFIIGVGGRDKYLAKGTVGRFAKEMMSANPERVYFSHWDEYFVPLWESPKWLDDYPPDTKAAFDEFNIEARFLRIMGSVYIPPKITILRSPLSTYYPYVSFPNNYANYRNLIEDAVSREGFNTTFDAGRMLEFSPGVKVTGGMPTPSDNYIKFIGNYTRPTLLFPLLDESRGIKIFNGEIYLRNGGSIKFY